MLILMLHIQTAALDFNSSVRKKNNPSFTMVPSKPPRAAVVHIWLHFFVPCNRSAAFGEDECCWQEAAVDFTAQGPAESLGFGLDGETRALERTNPNNRPMGADQFRLLNASVCLL